MKTFVVILLSSLVVSEAKQLPVQETTAYGYLRTTGVPEAERIRKLEERHLRVQNRIVGGIISKEGQVPWQAGLLSTIIGSNGTIGVCGGSLISPSRVVTAAHCWYDGVDQASRVTVVLGSTSLFSGGTRISTSEVYTHPWWFPILVRNDVAMIYLPTEVEVSTVIHPIPLPTKSQMLETYTGETAVVSGYGSTGDDASISSNQTLSLVNVTVMPTPVCFLSYPLHVTGAHVCTSGAEGSGPCGGDSGGPLYVYREGMPVLIGIVSFGSTSGCESGAPSAYTRTAGVSHFIRAHLTNLTDNIN